MDRAMDTSVGNGRGPFVELRLEVHHTDKHSPRQEVPLQIFHA